MSEQPSRPDEPTVAQPFAAAPAPTSPASSGPPAPSGPPAASGPAGRGPNWPARLVGLLLGVLLLGAGYLVAVAFLPRWWAQRVGNVSDGSFTTGIGFGLVVGFVFTALPLLALAATTKRHRAWRTRGALVVLAVLVAVPNLITLGIVHGTGNAAHAGERILDVDAPGFRGASLVGAVAAAVFVVVLALLLAGRRRRSREIARLKSELRTREAAGSAGAASNSSDGSSSGSSSGPQVGGRPG